MVEAPPDESVYHHSGSKKSAMKSETNFAIKDDEPDFLLALVVLLVWSSFPFVQFLRHCSTE